MMFSNFKAHLLVAVMAIMLIAAISVDAASNVRFINIKRALQTTSTGLDDDDDDFVGGACDTEMAAVETCLGPEPTGTCTEECIGNSAPEVADTPEFGDPANVEQLSAGIGQMNEYLGGLCSAVKTSTCTMVTDCCPDCADSIRAYLQCYLDSSASVFEQVANATSLLGNFTGADIPELKLDCDIKGAKCDGSGSSGSTISVLFSVAVAAAGMMFHAW